MAGNGRKQKPLTIEQIENALRATGGFVSYAAKELNVTQSAISQRVKASPHLQKVQKEISEQYLDLAESKLLKKIKKQEDLGAICFYLKCKGKGRGYIERQEVTGAEGGPIKVQKIERVIVDPEDT